MQTVAHFTGREITRDLIQEYKNQGGWNNDWALSQKIATDLGVKVEYGDVVSAFNERFLGKNGDGLIRRERWFPQEGLLERLTGRYELAIFTGRLRYEADISLKRFACGSAASIRLFARTTWLTESPRPMGCTRFSG